ncbi:MAG: hypothetical protein HOJ67_04645 [Rhodospirillaceae bacterium]|nr:hypothetical protein [Rhodospirillaceae bacterium]
MCGIFGLVTAPRNDVDSLVQRLFLLSESRGKEAAGLAIRHGQTIDVFKQPDLASEMMRKDEYRKLAKAKLMSPQSGEPLCVIGHSRLVTNGLEALPRNNQPIIHNQSVAIHNGIVVNDLNLWDQNQELPRHCDVDSEIILALYHKHRMAGAEPSTAVADVYGAIEGTASIAIMDAIDPRMLLATNNGSLYYFSDQKKKIFVFASERYILDRFLNESGLLASADGTDDVQHLQAHNGLVVECQNMVMDLFPLPPTTLQPKTKRASRTEKPISQKAANVVATENHERHNIIDHAEMLSPERAKLTRCSRCILPETMPFITFDEDGVCNYCHTYKPVNPLGLEAFRDIAEKHRRHDGEPDCMVAVSGGRDSCYGLHVLKNEFGLNPVAYTYDWGVITDLARRNQARLCGQLGVEHILVSADIRKKRDYVRQNIEAWLKRPNLGMIPLFMAGDKQYFYFANKVREQLGVNLSFLCENKIERAHFKSGFMGVYEGHGRTNNIGVAKVTKLLWRYGQEYALNPRYINRSLFDTLGAFWSTFITSHDHVQLFKYASWEEDVVVDVLRREYDWELATDTEATWRIGDGTAPFYNFIYYTVAGFTENDALRSNQIREGILDRETALKRVAVENRPRWDSLKWYAEVIGFNLTEAIVTICNMPRLYGDST